MDDFKFQNYNFTLECGGFTDSKVTNETAYHYVGRLNRGTCTATVKVINSCGATSSKSITFEITKG